MDPSKETFITFHWEDLFLSVDQTNTCNQKMQTYMYMYILRYSVNWRTATQDVLIHKKNLIIPKQVTV